MYDEKYAFSVSLIILFLQLHSISSFAGDGVFHCTGSVKREFGKFTNEILVIGGPTPPPPLYKDAQVSINKEKMH